MKYLKLIRSQNLLLLAFMQLVFRYGFLKLQNIHLALNDWQYGLLILATVLIAAAGYVINDINDQEIDTINKPGKNIVGNEITEDHAYNLYFGLTIIGLLIGFYLTYTIDKDSFFGIFVISSILLYLYATSFKQIPVVGNLTVAFVLALSVIVVGLFDIIPVIYPENRSQMLLYLDIILDYAIFGFLINLIREMVKDMEDIEGDKEHSIHSLPVILGIRKTKRIIFVLGIIVTAILLWYIATYLMENKLYLATIYGLLFVISLLIYFVIKIWSASSQKDFHHLSQILKLVIFFGIISIVIINLNILYNA